MRRILAFLAVGALTAVAIGSAAALTVDGGTIQAGEDLTLSCDADGVQVLGWGLEADDGSVDRVRIGGISDTCIGNDLFVNVTDASGTFAQGSAEPLTAAHTGDLPGDQVVVIFPTPVPAVGITDIHVFIEGPNSTPEAP